MIKNKFKEKEPYETINIIKSFFQKKNYEIIEEINFKQELNLWDSNLILSYNKREFLHSNGKGLTKEFCLASAYGELYERYCNKIFYIGNPFIINKIMKINFKNHHFYLDRNEKLLTFEESFKYFKDYLNLIEDSQGQAEYFFSNIFENKYIGVPYKNPFNQKDTIFIDPRIVTRIKGSTGMAAGNTLKEAFNQGMSEICEHYVRNQFYNQKLKCYYQLDLTTIKNDKLKKIINNIKDAGNDLYIYDFSYNFGMPVLLSVLVNHKTHNTTLNFGAFPYFDIALERVLTELYQGITNYNDIKIEGLMPSRDYYKINVEMAISSIISMTFKESFYEELFFNSVTVEPNDKIFLFQEKNNQIDNNLIFTYFKKLCDEKDLKVYYYDNSQIQNMQAIQIIVLNLPGLNEYNLPFKNILSKKEIYYHLINYYKILTKIFNNKKIELSEYNKLIQPFNKTENIAIGLFMMDSWSSLSHISNSDNLIYLLKYLNNLLDENEVIRETYYSSLFSEKLNKFILLKRYLKNNNYSIEEILKLFTILKFQISIEDIQNYNNLEYLLQEIIYYPLNNFYNSSDFLNYILTLSDNKT